MSKVKKTDYSHVDDALRGKVLIVVAEASTHTYSVSRVYEAYNAVFKKSETPQTCSSCLRNRVAELKKWLEEDDQAPVAPVVNFVETFIILNGEQHTVVDDDNVPTTIIFTPSAEGATSGIATDTKGTPAPHYLYEQNGKYYLVEGDSGEYREVQVCEEATDPADNETPVIPMVPAEPQYVDPGAPGFVAPALGSVRVPMGSGLPIDIQFEEGFKATPGVLAKGIAKRADGSKVTPGTYITATSDELAVQPGGKATLKSKLAVEEDLT